MHESIYHSAKKTCAPPKKELASLNPFSAMSRFYGLFIMFLKLQRADLFGLPTCREPHNGLTLTCASLTFTTRSAKGRLDQLFVNIYFCFTTIFVKLILLPIQVN